MTGKQLHEGLPAVLPGGAGLPSPDAMLGVWTSWMEQMTQAVGQGAGHQVLAQDPLMRSMDQMWNANPLREVIPVDWAGTAWALRTASGGRPHLGNGSGAARGSAGTGVSAEAAADVGSVRGKDAAARVAARMKGASGRDMGRS